jgi:hypothetical protein
MNKKATSFIAIILVVSSIYCKQYDILKLPKDYVSPKEELDVNCIKQKRSNRLWIVFSDRDENYTFKKPDGGRIKKKCSFMQSFYVVEESAEWVHIVEDNPEFTNKTTKKMNDYGWIKKKDLLLWNRCLRTKQNNPQRVIFGNSIYNIMDNKNHLGKMITFNSPYLSVEHAQTTGIQILYIYKIINNKILIGVREHNKGKNAIENILGWILDATVLNWESGLAIEANYEPIAVSERIDNNIKSYVFSTVQQSQKFIDDPQGKNLLYFWDNDSYGFRESGRKFRFPVINIKSNIIKCLVTGLLEERKKSTPDYKIDVDVLSPYAAIYLSNLISEKEIIQIRRKEIFIGLEGYVPISIVNLEYPLFKFLKLFTRPEIGKLYVSIEKLVSGGETMDRKIIKEVWLEMLYEQEGLDTISISNMTLDNASIQLFGLHTKRDFGNIVRITDITDSKVFLDKDFREYLDILREVLNKIDHIYNSNSYKYSFMSNDTPYYWIDFDLIQ